MDGCTATLPRLADAAPDGYAADARTDSIVSSRPVIGDMGDGELVGLARRGTKASIEALVRRYLRPAYAVALSVVRNPADAEDIASESLMTAMRRLDQCRDPARFAPWLLQSVRNRALRHLEQGKLRGALLDQVPQGTVVEADADRVVLRQRLVAALDRVTQVQREVVLLHDLENWTHAEIAAALEMSEVMSRQHLFVARKKLREALAETGTAGGESDHG
jgi:RNA polymerase sigma-70 factor (ECF subfamily)